jgi:hypothetical protein
MVTLGSTEAEAGESITRRISSKLRPDAATAHPLLAPDITLAPGRYRPGARGSGGHLVVVMYR